jgi:hypothetical protein
MDARFLEGNNLAHHYMTHCICYGPQMHVNLAPKRATSSVKIGGVDHLGRRCGRL